MAEPAITFAEWITFAADRIVRLGLLAPEDHRADFMRTQIGAALRKSAAHGRSGLSDGDPTRAVW